MRARTNRHYLLFTAGEQSGVNGFFAPAVAPDKVFGHLRKFDDH